MREFLLSTTKTRLFHRALYVIVGCLISLVAKHHVLADDANVDGLDFFETKIRPVLVEHCYECHSAKSVRVKGGFRVDLREGMRKGGESGDPAVVPGKPDEGTLMAALRHESYEMPPAGKLPDSVLADVQKWIRIGAPDPRDGRAESRKPREIDIEAARQTWTFRKPERTTPPTLHSKWNAWAKTDIDRFIAAKLQQAELAPVEDADRHALLRRLSYDLTGMPPTVEAIKRFIEDDSDEALVREVDRLLASNEFAERWARHWLDVARFAESSGGGRSLMFPHAWRFRDYVIQSFRDDKPFDQFLKEQIAGDLMPYDSQQQREQQLTATGYLVLGAINYELQDKQLLQMEVIDEQLEAIGRGFLGMTMACARCHDHKFDPISTRDYYSLAGIFSSTRSLTPGNVSGYVTRQLGSKQQHERLQQHNQAIKKAEQKVKDLEKQLAKLSSQRASSRTPGLVVDDAEAKLVGDWKHSTSQRPWHGKGYIHDKQQGKGEWSATFNFQLKQPGRYEVRVAYNAQSSRAPRVPVAVHHANGVAHHVLNQQQPPADAPFQLLGAFAFEKQASVVISTKGTDGFYVIVDAVELRRIDPPGEARSETEDTKATEDSAEQLRKKAMQRESARLTAALQQAKAAVQSLKKTRPPEPPVVMGVEDQQQPADGHIRIRGQVRVLGDQVDRGRFLSVIPQVDEGSHSWKVPAEQSGRLQLAQWMTSPEHPLTSRVIVNRVWSHLMGKGIVSTLDNFGVMGAAPTHPQLLDAMAVEFQEDGWSIKRLIRRIVLSRAYRMSSIETKEHRQRDPENLLLSRAFRRRLDAEAIRDSMLLVSGALQPLEGGRTIKKLSAYDLGYQFGEVHQRSIFVPAFRNARLEIFEVFDAPNPNLVSGGRSVSTLPTQALYLLNSPFVQKQASQTAERLLARIDDTEPQRIERLFLTLLNRPPHGPEQAWARECLKGQGEQSELARWARLTQLIMASVDYRYLY